MQPGEQIFASQHGKVIDMSEAMLVNRTRFTSSMKNELMEQFNQLTVQTRIPKSRLIDEAIEDLLKKYEKRRALD